MATKTASDDSTAKLRAKVRQLEAALEREREARRKLEASVNPDTAKPAGYRLRAAIHGQRPGS